MGSTTRPDASGFDALGDRLRGALLRPEDDEYDRARTVWNGQIDRYPAAIARCRGTADVIAAVNFAREQDLLLAVKSGGHDYAGNSVCDDGLVVDLSAMDGVRVDPDRATAYVEPGARWADVYHETKAFDLALPGGGGIVGVAGFTLGGGISYLSRKYGLACDHLVGADVVTASGDLVHASEDENPDLFWALRGGSGNFGIVTAFEYDLDRIGPTVLAGQVLHPTDDAKRVLQFYRTFMADAPDELGTWVIVTQAPSDPAIPAAYHGEPAVSIALCYDGDIDAGHEAVAPLREFGDPILDDVRRQSYTEFKLGSDDLYESLDRWYSKSRYLESLPDEAIDVMVDHIRTIPDSQTMIGLSRLGGAINRVDSTEMAFPHRNAAYEFDIWAAWSDPARDEELMEWARAFHEAMSSYSTGGVYVNMLSHDEQDRVRAAYGTNYERLADLKAQFDPENLFNMNQNIDPAE
jgi:FAD/FMN-containing dehydrogenase